VGGRAKRKKKEKTERKKGKIANIRTFIKHDG
jgi:hypothetical protein